MLGKTDDESGQAGLLCYERHVCFMIVNRQDLMIEAIRLELKLWQGGSGSCGGAPIV